MKCPHCSILVRGVPQEAVLLGRDAESNWVAVIQRCGACGRVIIEICEGERNVPEPPSEGDLPVSFKRRQLVQPLAFPHDLDRWSLPLELDREFREACRVLAASPRAAAALGRNCLRSILRSQAGVRPGTLGEEIDFFLSMVEVPVHLRNAVERLRHFGNYQEHPQKCEHPDSLYEVSQEEAQLTLQVVEILSRHYFGERETR